MNTLPSEAIWSEEHAQHVDCWVDGAQPFTEIVWVRCNDLDLLGLHQLSKTFAYKIGMGKGCQRIMSIYEKGDKALLKYKPATNELVVLNDSGLYNGPIENQVLPVTKLKLETSTSVGSQQMTDCCTSGNQPGCPHPQRRRSWLYNLRCSFPPSSNEKTFFNLSDKDTSLLTKD